MPPVILKHRQQQTPSNLGRRLPPPSPPLLLSHRDVNGNERTNNIIANPKYTYDYNDELRSKQPKSRNGYESYELIPSLQRTGNVCFREYSHECPTQNSGNISKTHLKTSSSQTSIQNNKFSHVQVKVQVLQQKFETITCTATNRDGSKLTHYPVKMDKPCFLQKLEDKTVEEGQPVELLARVQGATSVSWIRNGKILPNCPDFYQTFVKIEERESKCCLRIADVFTEDAGRFICKAYNRESGSTALCSARVTVTERKIYKIKMSDKEDLIKPASASSPPVTRKGKNGTCDSNFELTETVRQNQNGTPEVDTCENMDKHVTTDFVTSVIGTGQNQIKSAEKVENPKSDQNIIDEPQVAQMESENEKSVTVIESHDQDHDSKELIRDQVPENDDLETISGQNLELEKIESVEVKSNGSDCGGVESESGTETELQTETPNLPTHVDVTEIDVVPTSNDHPELRRIDSPEKIDSESDPVPEIKDLTLASNDTVQINQDREKSNCLDLSEFGKNSEAQIDINCSEENLDKVLVERVETQKKTHVDVLLDGSLIEIPDETFIEESLDKTLTEVQLLPGESDIDKSADSSSSVEETVNREDGRKPQVMGPSYILALKGETVHLRIKVSGNPPPSITWSRAGKLLEPDDRLKVEENGGFSSVNVENVSYDESGRYVAKVENEFGMVLHSTNLSVEGPPEPPSRSPAATFDERSNSISVSWSGAPYDGGSALTSYHLLVSQDEEEWTLACQSKWLTATIPSPDRGSSYRFRVHGENGYGLGPPSHVSIPVCIPGVCSITENSTNVRPEVGAGEDTGITMKDTPIRLGSYLELYEKGEELGKGRFGTVFKVTHKTTRKEFASKIIRCIKGTDKDKVRQEVEIMNLLRHPKLIELVDAFETAREIVIITEKINGGELFERVVADDFTLTEFDCVGFMRQIIDGVRFIHSKNIIHLDLKPENILCLTRSTYSIKIIDFGLSQKYDSTTPLRVLFGTPEFVAPEIINYEPISPASDMWALGVITYVLLSGLSPFMGDTDSETFANITAADFDFEDDSFSSISSDAKEFIMSLLVKRQEKRLTAEECLSNKWLAYPEPSKNIVIPTDKLKRFIIRRKWQKTGNAIRALGRITMLYSTRRSSEQAAAAAAAANGTGTGSIDSGISLSPTTTNPTIEFGTETATKGQPENKRLLQRQPRVNSSSNLS